MDHRKLLRTLALCVLVSLEWQIVSLSNVSDIGRLHDSKTSFYLLIYLLVIILKNLFNLPTSSNKLTVVFPNSFFAKQVYHPLSFKEAFWTSRVELFIVLLQLAQFRLCHVTTAGGFPTSTGQPIDLSSPSSNSMVELERVADGLSKPKKGNIKTSLLVKIDNTWSTKVRYRNQTSKKC